MSTHDEKNVSAAPKGAPRQLPQEPLKQPIGEKGRFTSRRKMEAVLRLFRGEDLDALSRELGVTAARLASWRAEVLASGHAALKSRPRDERDDEIRALRGKIGEITMANELLLERCRAKEAGRPLVQRRRRP